jgi:hypothetical protein
MGIYLIEKDGKLVEMTEEAYDSEILLQKLLADYPSLLAGDQIDNDKPRRWLLISREMSVPAEEGGSGRWSVDHLFLDQDAIPTLVEVKRSNDTRIRREVVGQMLDYAANAVVYWPVEAIQAQFEVTCNEFKLDPEEELTKLLSDDADHEQFWQKVKTNLQAGRLRLIFVSDEIPSELRRVVEFLNEQMDPAEVLAVEIKQYIGEGLKTLVPRVIGQTAEAQRKKPPSPPRWDEPLFFQEMTAERNPTEVKVAESILEWAKRKSLRSDWGKGGKTGSYTLRLDYKELAYGLITVWTDGKVQIPFGNLMKRAPFDDEMRRVELLRQLNTISGVNISKDGITKFPSIPLMVMGDESTLQHFLNILDWVIQEIKAL